jgi:hypothetical protein
MPITTLNRVIAIFIVGAVPVAWLYLRWGGLIPNFGSVDTVFSAILAIPLTAFFGLVVDGAADPVRYLIKRAVNWDRLCLWSWLHEDELAKLRKWNGEIQALSNAGVIKIRVADKPGEADEFSAMNFAAGYFLANASKEQIAWLNSHYSTYSLATSFALLGFVISALDTWLFVDWNTGALEFVAATVAAILLIGTAFDGYVYSYQLAARFTVIHLHQPQAAATSSAGSADEDL